MKNPVHRLILAITMAASLIFLAGCEERTDYEGFSRHALTVFIWERYRPQPQSVGK